LINAATTSLGPTDAPISFIDGTRTIGMKAQTGNVGDEYPLTFNAIIPEVA
jgi:hypothetical protein